jgi:hypothetical protein
LSLTSSQVHKENKQTSEQQITVQCAEFWEHKRALPSLESKKASWRRGCSSLFVKGEDSPSRKKGVLIK